MRAIVNFTTKQGMTALPSQHVEGESIQDIAAKAHKIGKKGDCYTFSIIHDDLAYHYSQDYGQRIGVNNIKTGRTIE